jgi:predicted lipid-binding transport protein (Tim44 family)
VIGGIAGLGVLLGVVIGLIGVVVMASGGGAAIAAGAVLLLIGLVIAIAGAVFGGGRAACSASPCTATWPRTPSSGRSPFPSSRAPPAPAEPEPVVAQPTTPGRGAHSATGLAMSGDPVHHVDKGT